MATINHKTYNEATETFKDFSVYDGKETLIFKVDGSEGNVGIGTSSPTDTIGYGRALDIQSSTGAVVYLRDSNAPTTQYGFLAFDGTDNGLKLHNANSSGFLRFDTNATEKMRITSTGNVGIGTSTPSVLLDVQGNSAAVRVAEVGGAEARLVSGGSSSFVGTYSNHPLLILTNSGEKMRIEAGGNVGIGTSSPTATLDVGGEIKLSSDLYMGHDRFLRFERNSGSTSIQTLGIPTGTDDVSLLTTGDFNLVTGSLSNLLTVKQAGNVGIGTTSPTGKLEVNGAMRTTRLGAASQYIEVDGGDATGGFITNTGVGKILTIRNSSTGSSDVVFDQTIASTYTFKQAGTQILRIDADGVKFGTDSAAANALDDYEEGTFTPTYANGLTGVTYTNTTGKYTKIGRAVHWSLRIQATAATADAANVQLGGFPFASGPAPENTGSIGYFSVYTTDVVYMYNNSNSTNIVAFYKKNADPLIGTDLTSVTGTIHCSGTYFV